MSLDTTAHAFRYLAGLPSVSQGIPSGAVLSFALLDAQTGEPAAFIKAGVIYGGDGLRLMSLGGASFAQSIAYAAAITPNCDTTDIANVGALTGNITIANPTGTPVDGQDLQFRLAEDGTGGWVITWGNGYAFGTDVTLALIPTTASAKWEMIFTWNAAEVKWRCRGIVRGF